jgi:ATP-dependent DNA helicase RecQ
LRLEKMRTYAELRDCRREYLLEYFADEDIVAPCRHCDNCESLGAKTEQEHTRAKPITSLRFPVHTRVTHQKFGKGVVQSYGSGKIEVLFDTAGRKRMSLALVLKRNLLARMDDSNASRREGSQQS